MARESAFIKRNFHYNTWPNAMFELAQFFSQSENFEVIDSYSSHYQTNKGSTPATYGAHRYIGDPIGDDDPAQPGYKHWESSDDLGSSNDWFVVECKTSIHTGLPNWQLKIQWHQSASGYSDPSGVDYGLNGSGRISCGRWSPYGGWDFDPSTPDFAPVGPSYNSAPDGTFIASGFNYVAITLDEGQLVAFRRASGDFYNFKDFGTFIGDINPVDAAIQQMPRVQITAGASCSLNGQNGVLADNGMLCEDDFGTAGFSAIRFEDKDGNIQSANWSLPSNAALLRQQSQPNMYPTNPELDMAPFQPMPIGYGLIGDIPAMAIGQGVGGTLFDNKEWLSSASTYCVMMRWDGVTDL